MESLRDNIYSIGHYLVLKNEINLLKEWTGPVVNTDGSTSVKHRVNEQWPGVQWPCTVTVRNDERKHLKKTKATGSVERAFSWSGGGICKGPESGKCLKKKNVSFC